MDFGAWLFLKYKGEGLFKIKVFDFILNEVSYKKPLKNNGFSDFLDYVCQTHASI